jgi:hypothetical protein
MVPVRHFSPAIRSFITAEAFVWQQLNYRTSVSGIVA